MSKKESGGFKLLVVILIGGVAVGAIALIRKEVGTPTPAPVTSHPTEITSATPPVASSASPVASVTPLDAALAPSPGDRAVLREAAAAGDLAKVQELAGKGVLLPGALAYAAKGGNIALITWLFDHGVDPHEDEDDAVPPLLVADSNAGVVNLLLARGVKEPSIASAVRAGAPNAVTRDLAKKKEDAKGHTEEGEPYLHLAIAQNAGAARLGIVDALLKAGADPNTTFQHTPALAEAVSSLQKKSEGAMDVAKLLLTKGANVDLETLSAAASLDKPDGDALKELFLAHKMAPEAAYLMIMNERDPKMIARIGAKGVGWTSEHPMLPPTPPLVAAARDLDVERVKALLAAGAPVDRAGEGDETALFSTIDAAPPDSAEAAAIVTALLAKGANANKRTAGGRRPLHAASEKGEEAIVKALLAKGAHVDDEVNGTSALEAAEANGHQGVAKVLLAGGAKKKKKTD